MPDLLVRLPLCRVLRIAFMLLKICFLAHLLGCFWFGVHLLMSSDPTQTTWARSYDDGKAAVEGAHLSAQYLYAVYWAVTTLTTVGYGDLTPTNDAERTYALGSMLCSALVFGYMMSSVGSLVASMDRQVSGEILRTVPRGRAATYLYGQIVAEPCICAMPCEYNFMWVLQAALLEEKTDAVKEYVAWRSLPRDLALRVKKHYSFHYTRRPAFDEVELLDGLSPSLRAEVTRY